MQTQFGGAFDPENMKPQLFYFDSEEWAEPVDTETALTIETEKDFSFEDIKLRDIVTKVNTGQKLTSLELSVLKEEDSRLYAKALHADEARRELYRKMQDNPENAFSEMRQLMSEAAEEHNRTVEFSEPAERDIISRALYDEYRKFSSISGILQK